MDGKSWPIQAYKVFTFAVTRHSNVPKMNYDQESYENTQNGVRLNVTRLHV
jgi:hypothetical protein